MGESIKKTLTEISARVGVSRPTCYLYIHQVLCARSFKIQIHQGLHHEDYDRRVQCVEQLLPYLENSELKNLIFFLMKQLFIHQVGLISRIVEFGVQINPMKSKSIGIKVRKLMLCHVIGLHHWTVLFQRKCKW